MAGSEELSGFSLQEPHESSNTGEKPKVALKTGYSSALIQSLIHIPSIAISLGVLSLTFRQVFWQDLEAYSGSVLSALQFAAKVHEGLIILSLCSIVLYHIRYGLIGSQGVPLGLLSSGLLLNSTVYPFSAEFWGGATSTRLRGSRRLFFVPGILGAIVLANLAAPSSAIAMIPRLDWWPLRELWPHNRIEFSAYIHAANATLFPATITKDLLPNHCSGYNAYLHADCPSNGLSRLIANSGFLTNTDPAFWNSVGAFNITMPSSNDSVIRFLSGRVDPNSCQASAIPDFLASVMSNYWTTTRDWSLPLSKTYTLANPMWYIPRPRIKISLKTSAGIVVPSEPAVQVQCGATSFGAQDIVFPHEYISGSPWGESAFVNANWSIASSEISHIALNDESGKVNFTWVELGYDQAVRPSLAGVFTMPKFNPKAHLNNAIYACTVFANWRPTEAWIVPATDMFVHEASPACCADDGGTGMHIETRWAESLNVNYDVSGSNQTAMEAIGSACAISAGNGDGSSNPNAVSQCLGMALSLYITDGLSRVQSAVPTYLVAAGPDQNFPRQGAQDIFIQSLAEAQTYTSLIPNITLMDLQDATRYTEFYFEILRFGYGYGFRGILIYVAVAVLLTHVLLALIHMGVVLASGVSSNIWATVGELLLLAANSSPSDRLKNTSAGVNKKQTWAVITKVRETWDERLELVFEDENDDTVYDQRRRRTLVKAGKKYA